MAPPDFDRDYERVFYGLWSPQLHPRVFLMHRMSFETLWMHCRFRHTGLGILNTDVLAHILCLVEVPYV